MTQEQINRYSELMAKFLGFKPYNDGRYGTMWPDPTKKGNPVVIGMAYHTSYDWLHRVWEKFRDLKVSPSVEFMLHRDYCYSIREALTDLPLDKAFIKVGKGLEWYYSLNKQL